MKINDINRLQGINKYRKTSQKENIKAKSSKKDQISISNEAKILLEQNKEVVNKQKVSELKEKVNNGTYSVDSKQVAEKMLEWFRKE